MRSLYTSAAAEKPFLPAAPPQFHGVSEDAAPDKSTYVKDTWQPAFIIAGYTRISGVTKARLQI